MEIEIHHALLYDNAATLNTHRTFINDCWSYVHENELDWNIHFIFLLLHLHKHIMYSGAGFRQFMDLAVVIQQINTLNWDWIYTTLSNLGLDETARTWFGLIAIWFDIHAPEAASLSDGQIKKVTEKIFANGVFGFHDKKNQNNQSFNAIYTSRYPQLKMLQRTLLVFFPSYDAVCHIDHYSFVKGKKWLLPAVWIYRAFRGIRHDGIQRIKALLKSSLISSKVFKKKNRY